MSQFTYYFNPLTPQDLTAKALILSLISSTDTDRQMIGSLIHAGALFDIEPATMRVAATRLLKDGLLESPERGVYVPGRKAQALTRRVQQWQDVASKVVAWNGDWLVAMTHHLGRRDRRQLRTRERALALFGYQEAEAGLWVRPANLARAIEAHREDLVGIGADATMPVLRVLEVSAPDIGGWPGLWSAQALETSYREAISAMTESLKGLPGLTVAEAARETLLIGQAAIRAINFDPLLPPQLGNQGLFLEMVSTMRAYNEAGIECWRAYHGANAPSDA
ncbi:hypothetical protein HHI_04102 [Hyphomonas hirschiana VP5]|uniref:PaaX family transcriptional regulator n=1 Tax=Hyphomonas hirschiana VP5 TaxID=1280951 RepID=A0A059FZH2_9PROT|nr:MULTISPECIES: hypothetical protein [Hyphomonas]KCZ95925.1 hypothetical protein HHI_04102 [Hyphomonas hirschiana VP5]